MNIVNIDKAISVMKRAENLNMAYWQSDKSGNVHSANKVNSIEELHKCGNTACFAGYIAISPEFHSDGGERYQDGSPVFAKPVGGSTFYDHNAIATWLGVDDDIAHDFIYGNLGADRFSNFYNKSWDAVVPQDVIDKLEELKAIGEEQFLKRYGN